MLDKYLEELQKEASQPTLDNLPIAALAKLAGIKIAARDMPAGTKARIASHVGKKKTAGISPKLIQQLKTIGVGSTPVAAGAATGALAAGEDKRLKGALLGGLLGLGSGFVAGDLAAPTSLGKFIAAMSVGGAVGGGIGGYAIRPDGKKKTATLDNLKDPGLTQGLSGSMRALGAGGVLKPMATGFGVGSGVNLLGSGLGAAISKARGGKVGKGALIGFGASIIPSLGAQMAVQEPMMRRALAKKGITRDFGGKYWTARHRFTPEAYEKYVKTSAWDTTLQKLAQEPSHEDLQRQLMEADPEHMGRRYGMTGAAGGTLAGGLAAIPAFAKFRGAGKLLGLAAPAVGGLIGKHLGTRAGEQEASHESALQHALYSTGLREGAMMGAQAAMQHMYGGQDDEGMDVHASVRSRRPFDKTGSAAAAATAGGKSFAQLGKDSLMWLAHRPELTAGVIGGVGGAGIGAATSDDKKHTARRAIVGGLTGATLGGLGGAFFRQLGVGESLSRVKGYRVGLAEGITSGQAAGMAEGVQTGRLKGTLDTINKIKNTKFPLIPKSRVERLSNELSKGLSELQEISDPELTQKGLDELLKKVTSLK